MIGAPVPGVVNALQVTIPGRSPSVPSVKALGNAREEKKAHIGHDGNERADQLAREAVKNSQIRINTPQSWACYKAQLKQEIYSECEQRRTNDNAYRMSKIFYPIPDSDKAKNISKLSQGQLKTLIELITGQNNLNYMNNKVYDSEDLCRFWEKKRKHLIILLTIAHVSIWTDVINYKTNLS